MLVGAACGLVRAAAPPSAVTMPSIVAAPVHDPVLPAWDGPTFSPPPAPGVHPRVLISPSDLPALRERLEKTASGRRAINGVRGWLQLALFKDGKALNKTYTALVAGDSTALELAETAWFRSKVSLALCLEAFDCWVRDDAVRGKNVAAALVTYNKICNGEFKNINNVPNADFNMGFCYDFAYNFMTDAQRNTVRAVIAKATAGKKSHGMDMPAHARSYNWMPAGTELTLLALCIEGEPGYDPNVYRQTVPLMTDFLTYGIYPSGTPTEGTHYYNFGMDHGAQTLLAMAKRGDVLFNHPHYRAQKYWYLASIEPFGYAFSMMHDTPNDAGGLTANYVLQKYVYPQDPVVDFVWRNRVHDDYAGLGFYNDLLFSALYGTDWQGGQATVSAPKTVDQWGVDTTKPLPATAVPPLNPASIKQPLSYYCPNRGLLVTRDAWATDGMELSFEYRPDIYGAGHAHSDRNNFTLSALGVKWGIDRGFHVAETKDHSCMLIDGKGQGFFGPAGRAVAYLDTPFATVGVGDAAYAYAHRYNIKSRISNPALKDLAWELERLKWVDGRYVMQSAPLKDNELEGNPTYKAPYNPVAYAFRSATLVRGQYPYVLIFDDLRKDTAAHDYQWLLQTPMDRVFTPRDATRGVLSLEKATPTSPQLLVQALDSEGVTFDYQTYKVQRTPETEDTTVFGDGKRLVVSRHAVEANLKMLLLPQRPGQPQPTVTWNTDHRRARIDMAGQSDELTFEKQADGRTGFALVRANGDVLVVGLRDFSPKPGVRITLGGPGNVALSNGTVYLSGAGWKTCTITGVPVQQVNHDGSVAKSVITAKGCQLTEVTEQ
ncbi:MAG TPA: hypothetical protein VGL77_15865 [Armatimonadota bacterium]|jgi:hypothetical protein